MPSSQPAKTLAPSKSAQSVSVNWMFGVDPPLPLHEPSLRLLVSPVVPSFATQVGAAVEPELAVISTVTDEPRLNTASEPPPSPMMLNSTSCQAPASPVTVSASLVLNAWLPLANTRPSLPPLAAVPVILRLARLVIAIVGADTAALFLKVMLTTFACRTRCMRRFCAPFMRTRGSRALTPRQPRSCPEWWPYTGKDTAKIGPVPCAAALPDLKVPDHRPLASNKVYFVGHPVAVVVAETKSAARDAVDLIEVDYEELPVALDEEKAADAKERGGIHEQFGTNVAYKLTAGEGDIEAALKSADKVVKQRILQQALAPIAMEPRGVLARYFPGEQELTLGRLHRYRICAGRKWQS